MAMACKEGVGDRGRSETVRVGPLRFSATKQEGREAVMSGAHRWIRTDFIGMS